MVPWRFGDLSCEDCEFISGCDSSVKVAVVGRLCSVEIGGCICEGRSGE